MTVLDNLRGEVIAQSESLAPLRQVTQPAELSSLPRAAEAEAEAEKNNDDEGPGCLDR
jgi:hypothetical protein